MQEWLAERLSVHMQMCNSLRALLQNFRPGRAIESCSHPQNRRQQAPRQAPVMLLSVHPACSATSCIPICSGWSDERHKLLQGCRSWPAGHAWPCTGAAGKLPLAPVKAATQLWLAPPLRNWLPMEADLLAWPLACQPTADVCESVVQVHAESPHPVPKRGGLRNLGQSQCMCMAPIGLPMRLQAWQPGWMGRYWP